MHHPPILPYCGLTIILSTISRHDKYQLISGFAGQYFESILRPINRLQCDIRLVDNASDLLPNTKVVLLLGPQANDRYSPHTLDEQRGSPFIKDNIIYISSYDPQDSFDRRDYSSDEDDPTDSPVDDTGKGKSRTQRKNWRWWLWADIRKVKRILNEGTQPRLHIPTVFYPDGPTIINKLQQTHGQQLFIDIETDREFLLTCIGLGFGDSKSKNLDSVYVVPFKRYNRTLAYEPLVAQNFIRHLAIAMANNQCVLHNSMFDLFVLAYKYKIPFPRSIFDTMLGWHRLHPEVEKSLGHLISYYTDEPFHKNDGFFDPHNASQEEQLWQYNANDIKGTFLGYQGVMSEITTLGQKASIDQANSSIRPYLTMMYKGMKIDCDKLVELYNEFENKGLQLNRCLNVITGQEINARSPKQVSDYLFNQLGLPKPLKNPTEEKTLLKLLTKHNVPSVKLITAIRGERKLASSLKFNTWQNSRLTCAYNIAGTDTFRLGSRSLLRFKGAFRGYGTNNQNLHKKVKKCVIPDDGKILVKRDQSGAEALIVAYLCRPGNFRNLFIHGVKPHVFVGLHLFQNVWKKHIDSSLVDTACSTSIENLRSISGWSELDTLIKSSDNWTGGQRYYFIAKQVCHSSNYAIGWPTFQLNVLLKSEGLVALTPSQSRLFLDLYHSLFPEIRQWHSEVQNTLATTRTLVNCFGYPREFTGPLGHDMYKAGYAFNPQSTVGCITHIAITNLQNYIEQHGLDWDILNNEHDSYMVQCPSDQLSTCADKMQEFIEQDLEWKGTKFKMKSECQVGMNWKEMEDYK